MEQERHSEALYSIMGARRPWEKVGEYLRLQTSSNILYPIMMSFEAWVGDLMTLYTGVKFAIQSSEEAGLGEAEDYF